MAPRRPRVVRPARGPFRCTPPCTPSPVAPAAAPARCHTLEASCPYAQPPRPADRRRRVGVAAVVGRPYLADAATTVQSTSPATPPPRPTRRPTSPRAGWGQALPVFLRPDVAVVNSALSGASSKSFVDLGRLDLILGRDQPGDMLLVSFGHNDEKTEDPPATPTLDTFQDYLRSTSTAPGPRAPTRCWSPRSSGVGSPPAASRPSHGDYPDAMRALAADRTPADRPDRVCLALWDELGPEATKDVFLCLDAGRVAQLSGRRRRQHPLPGARRDRGGPPGRRAAEQPEGPADGRLPAPDHHYPARLADRLAVLTPVTTRIGPGFPCRPWFPASVAAQARTRGSDQSTAAAVGGVGRVCQSGT